MAPRRSGRPDARATEMLNVHILRTAARLFNELGYAAASMEQIAAAAGAGKQTIYRRYPSKEDLFKAALKDQTDVLLRSATLAVSRSASPLGGLRNFVRELLDHVLDPHTVDIYRVLISESVRFPGVVDHTMRNIVGPIHTTIRELLEAARKAGQIRRSCEVESTLHALTGLITGWAVHQRLLGRKILRSKAQREAFFDNAWAIFLRGVAPA